MLWQIDIYPASGQPDLESERVSAEAADLGIADHLRMHSARGYLLEGDADPPAIQMLADQLLADGVVETVRIAPDNRHIAFPQ